MTEVKIVILRFDVPFFCSFSMALEIRPIKVPEEGRMGIQLLINNRIN